MDEDTNREYGDEYELPERFREIGARIQAVSGTDYDLALIMDDYINAYADGGTVYLTSGALRNCDDDEIAYMIGHEVAHNVNGHVLESYIHNQALYETISDRLNSSDSPLKSLVAGLLIGTVATVVFKANDRRNEFSVDRIGYALAEAAGYDGGRARALLARLGGEGGIFASHPSAGKRIINLS